MPHRAITAFLCALSGLLAFGLAAAADADDVLWLGRTQATLAWTPPTQGIVDRYFVLVTRNGGVETLEQVVTSPRATIAGGFGDRIGVRVRAVGRAVPGGPPVLSPPSAVSPTIHLLPLNPPSGGWGGLMLSHCASCQVLRLRPIADPSLAVDRFAPPAPWRLVGRGSARFPHYEQLWQHAASGTMLLIAIDSDASVGGYTTIPDLKSHRALQLAELDGDPEPEIVTYVASGPVLVFWERRGLEIQPMGYLNIPPGWNLVGAEDLDADGRAELWFQWGLPGTVDVLSWSPSGIQWRGRLSTGVSGDAASVVAVADFDVNGTPDLLWRDSTGQLTISYVGLQGASVSLLRNVAFPRLPGDAMLEVVGVTEVASTPGPEIVVRNTQTGEVGAILPLASSFDARVPLLAPDPGFELVSVE